MGSISAHNVATVSPSGVTSFTVSTKSIPLKDTETSYVVPAGTKRFVLKNRGNAIIKLSHATGLIAAGTYYSLEAGLAYQEVDLNITSSLTIYLEATRASQTLEIVQWS